MAASDLSNSWRANSEENGQCSTGIKDDDKWIISIVEDKPLPPRKNIIQKVVPQLRKDKQNNDFFDPAVVSIGPYHHGRPELEEMENVKTRMAPAFVADSKRDIRQFRDKISEVVTDARNCYLHGSIDAYDDETFIRMMFVDGCFLLFLIDKYVKYQKDDLNELFGYLGHGRLPILLGDLILLENQLPFLVLQTLMSARFPEDEGDGLIETFIDMVCIQDLETLRKVKSGQRSNGNKYDGDQKPLHFLELVRRRSLGSHSPTTGHVSSTKGEDGPHKQDQPRRSFKPRRWSRLRGHRATKPKDPVTMLFSNSFRSATELKVRGIHFRPSNTFWFNDLTFTSGWPYGLVKLPQVMVTTQSKRFFLNLITDELAPFRFSGLEVCSYINFMNSLINGADDVIELRSHNIIHNFLSTDDDVAKLFNTLAAFSAVRPQPGMITDVAYQIQEHYNSKRKTWTAQLLHNHFSNPWTAFAFFAATFALVLTFIQTFFPR